MNVAACGLGGQGKANLDAIAQKYNATAYPHTRDALIRAAAAKKLPMLIEKPWAASTAQGKALEALCGGALVSDARRSRGRSLERDRVHRSGDTKRPGPAECTRVGTSFHCIRTGEPPTATIADGLRCVALAEAIYQSAHEGRKVSISL